MTKIREGYKETEIGVIPEDWEVKELSRVADVKGGKRIPKGYDLEDKNTGFPYIRVADMHKGGINTSNIKYVPVEIEPAIKKYKISKEDIFISVAGTLGVIGSVPDELHNANLTENADKICNIKCNKDYLMYYLQAPYIQNIISNERTVGAQPKLALTRIQKFLIGLPKPQEQQRIAEILSTTDEHIDKLDKTIEDYQLLKKGMMKKLLTEGISHTEFKETEIGRIPKEWEVVELGDFVQFSNGYAFNSKNYSEFGKTIVRMSNISIEGRFQINADNVRYCSEEVYSLLKKFWLYKNDLVVCMTDVTPEKNIIGRTAIIDEDNKYILNQRVGRILVNNANYCDIKYLHYFTNSEVYLNRIRDTSGGSAQSNASTNEILKSPIVIPSIEEQKQIALTLNSIDERICLLLNGREDFIQLKKALIEKLLTGKIRTI